MNKSIAVVEGQPPDLFALRPEFTRQFAYKDGQIFDVLISGKSYLVGSCLGRVRAIIDENGEVLSLVYPLMTGGDFELLDETMIAKYRSIVAAYDKKKSLTPDLSQGPDALPKEYYRIRGYP